MALLHNIVTIRTSAIRSLVKGNEGKHPSLQTRYNLELALSKVIFEFKNYRTLAIISQSWLLFWNSNIQILTCLVSYVLYSYVALQVQVASFKSVGFSHVSSLEITQTSLLTITFEYPNCTQYVQSLLFCKRGFSW